MYESSDGKLDKNQQLPGGLARVEVTLVGKTPIMFNRLTEQVLWAIETGEKKPTTSEKLSRDERALQALHTAGDQPVVPAEMLVACLIDAGRFVKMSGKKQISTRTDTILPALMTMETAVMPIESEAGWHVDVRPGRNQQGGVVVLVRPMFDDWKIRPVITIDLDEVSEAKIRELFDKAGMRTGLGEFRPAKKGFFGQFRVECWKRLDRSNETQAA